MRLELTRRADYAVRAVLALAQADRQMSSGELAQRMEMPPKFLPQIMPALVRDGILERTLGRNGGYVLARPARAISLLDVIEAADGQPPERRCVLRSGACRRDTPCVVHPAVIDAQIALRGVLCASDFGSLLDGGTYHRPAPPARDWIAG
jgi:Rrf2 family protein